MWGIRGGIAVGLWPTSGPRGLFRVYTPYLGQPHGRMVNFVSVEPIVRGRRALSELEVGATSGQRGLSMWTVPDRSDLSPRPLDRPLAGRITKVEGTEALTFTVTLERFRNGAQPVIEVKLRDDRPHEIGFRVFSAPGSDPMDACVLSATMGNYGRLRQLWLKDEVVHARQVWSVFKPDPLNFTLWEEWPRERLLTRGGEVIAAMTTDEADPQSAEYDSKIPPHWRYQGRPATHVWRTKAAPRVMVRANARTTYWGESDPIPGGIAFENFEIMAPFRQGQEFRFSVTPDPPSRLGFKSRPRAS